MSELVNLTQTLVLKHDNAYCVSGQDGGLPLTGDHPLGLYHEDCRHLRGHELRVGGRRPRLLVGSDVTGDQAIVEQTNPDLVLPDGRDLPAQSLRIRLERRIAGGAMTDRIVVTSHAAVDPLELDLELRVDADFVPMLEVREMVPRVPRDVVVTAEGHTLTFAAEGLDRRVRTTTVSCPGATADLDGLLRAPLCLGCLEQAAFDVTYVPGEGDPQPAGRAGPAAARSGDEADAWLADRPHVRVDDDLVARVLHRSLLDARMLISRLDGQRYHAAGVPWYATLFGRDSIITALQLIAFEPKLAEETLRLHARRMGTRYDDLYDEEPGKVIHELRLGEVATAGLSPLTRYYGTIDATPLWLCLLCEHADWTGSPALFRELRPQVEQALRWIDEYGDLDGDGLLEYRCRSPRGLVNQGWKDSWDGIVDERGAVLEAPIALVEAQGYAMRAKRRLAGLYALEGEPDRARELLDEAARLAGLIERFWLPEEGFYAMALDAAKRPSRALASNQGHLLWALAVPPERAEAVRDALMGDTAHSGWGVRTLADGERAFNPMGYHTGSIWPHDNAMLAVGLRKYGFDEAFLRILENLLDAAGCFPEYRLPELFAGYPRVSYEEPVPYPVACRPQAWAAGALPATLIAGLGLVPDALNGRLRIRRPSLPRHVSALALRDLRVADTRIDLRFDRVGGAAGGVALTEVDIDGDADVVLEMGAGRVDRELAPNLEAVRSAALGPL